MGKLGMWVRLGGGEPQRCSMIPLPGSQGRRWRIQLEDGRVVEPSEPCRVLGGFDSDRALLAVSGFRTA